MREEISKNKTVNNNNINNIISKIYRRKFQLIYMWCFIHNEHLK